MDAQDSQDSFPEHLGGRGLSCLEPFDVKLLEAKVVRMTYNTSEWSLSFSGPSFFLCHGRGRICPLQAQPSRLIVPLHAFTSSGIDVRKMYPNFVMATLVLLLQPVCLLEGERLHASELAIRFQNPVVSRNRTRQPSHPVLLLVPAMVWGRMARVSSG